jgi:hypothetical protein
MSSPIKYIDTKRYHKSNYDNALKYIIPSLYFEEDEKLKEKEIDIVDRVINSHLNIIGNISSVINIGSVTGSVFSAMDTPEGIAQFFVKQNNLTDLDANDFERKILIPLGKSFRDFNSSSEFSQYVEEELLPGIRLNNPSFDFLDGGTTSDNHIYLINNLSWLYFLNKQYSNTLTYQPYEYVHDVLLDKLYNQETIDLADGIKGLTTYIWKNYQLCASWSSLDILPEEFVPAIALTGDQFTSGTQQLEKLLTLVDVIYSPLHIDNSDARVRDAIDDYLLNSFLITDKKYTGPFTKLIKAFSFAFADYSNDVDRLEILNDLNRCPDEYLPLLAELIGWELFGSEPDRWRLQLANAVDIYRTVGTKRSIQFAVDSILGQDVFDVSSNISELWESYIPNLIYYALATESTFFKKTVVTPTLGLSNLGIAPQEIPVKAETWNPELAQRYGISVYNTSNTDTNIRLCVDQIILELVTLYRTSFIFNGKPFPLNSVDFSFNYRGRNFSVPPFEEYPYYLNVRINQNMIDSIIDKLVCYGVRNEFAFQVGNYIREKVFNAPQTLAVKNGWLLFTSSVEYPTNWGDVISDISNSRPEYFPLWNAKSSYFKVTFDASSFDFSKDSLEADSSETLKIASKAAQRFSPAHAIPEVLLRANEEDDYDFNYTVAQFVNLERVTHGGLAASSAGLSKFGTSGIVISNYKRGITPSSTPTFGRGQVDSLVDSILNPQGASISALPRRAFRRRNLKNILPKDGFYNRTGFNMPVSPQDYNLTDNNFFPLGLIPSSMQYVPIPDYNNIPAIYNICENMNSSSVYSGLAVSNTYPVRGWNPVEYN